MKKSPEELINKAALYQMNDKPRLALKHLLESLKITKKYPQIYCKIYHQKMILCDWHNTKKYKRLADKYFHYDSPFANILRVDDPRKNLRVASHARISSRI